MALEDEELIYNIRIGNREAEELLFFRYEKKLRPILEKYYLLFIKLGYSNEDKKALIWDSIFRACKRYDYNQGVFYSFCLKLLDIKIRDMFRTYNQELQMTNVDIYSNDELQDISEYLSDSSINLDGNVYLDKIIDSIKEIGEKEYEIIVLICQGYSYEEISFKYKISEKKISNIITKVRRYLKDKFK